MFYIMAIKPLLNAQFDYDYPLRSYLHDTIVVYTIVCCVVQE